MPTWLLVLIIVLGVIVIIMGALVIWSRRMEKKQAVQDEEMRKNAQNMTLYVIDKKKLHIKEAGLPKVVYENTPKVAKLSKVPIIKVKAGNRVMNLMCDPVVYKEILPKQEIKAQVAGLYVVSAKRVRGPVVETDKKGKPKKKKESIIDKLR